MKPVTLTALAATGALTVALGAVPLGGPMLGGCAGLALAGSGMIVCGLVLRRQHRAAAPAARPATLAAAPLSVPVLAPVPRFFPEGGPMGQVVPFGRKADTVSDARLTRDLLRRAERVCAATRARIETQTEPG